MSTIPGFRFIARTKTINGKPATAIGPAYTSQGRTVYLANPEDRRDHDDERHVFAFGGHTTHGATHIMAWGTYQDAFDIAGEYLTERWPGFLADESVREAYAEYLDEHGLDEATMTDDERSDAYEAAEVDTITFGNASEHLHSADCHDGISNPSRADLIDYCYPGGPVSWRREDTFTERAPTYRPTRRDDDPTFHARAWSAAWRTLESEVAMAATHANVSARGKERIRAAMLGHPFVIGPAYFPGTYRD